MEDPVNPVSFAGGLVWLFEDGPVETRHGRYIRKQQTRFESILEDLGGDIEWEYSDILVGEEIVREGSDIEDLGADVLPLEHPSVEMFTQEDLCNLHVAFVIVDPSLAGRPIVACSEHFLNLTGHSKREVVGLSLGSLLTRETRDSWNHARYDALCKNECGTFAAAEANQEGVMQHDEGELMGQFVGTRKNGGVFRCQALVRQVFLDDEMFVVCVFDEIPETTSGQEVEHQSDEFVCIYSKVQREFSLTSRTLAASFWCDIPFRRQEATDWHD